MTHEDDHSLLAWLRGKALEAHNLANICTVSRTAPSREQTRFEAQEDAFNEVIAYIEHGRIDQRPHIKGCMEE